MTRFSSIFSQLLQLFPRLEFEQAVKEHHAERSTKGFSSWSQFVALLFCQLGRATDSTKLRAAAAADRANPAAVAASTIAIGRPAASTRRPGKNGRRVAAATVGIGTLGANASAVCLFSGNPLGQWWRAEDCPFKQRRCGSVEPLQH